MVHKIKKELERTIYFYEINSFDPIWLLGLLRTINSLKTNEPPVCVCNQYEENGFSASKISVKKCQNFFELLVIDRTAIDRVNKKLQSCKLFKYV